MEHELYMNKWCNDTQFNTDAMLIQQTPPSSPNKNLQDDSDNDSLTDVSSIIEIKSSFMNHDQTSKYNNASMECKSTMQNDTSTHDQYVPDDQLLQSLVNYANSFNLDETLYSIIHLKNQSDATNSNEQLSTNYVPSLFENDRLRQHNYCEDLRHDAQSTMIIKHDSTKSIPSHFFSLKKSEDDDNNDKHSDDNSTVMDESKFDWEYLSNPIDCSNKSSTNLFENYQKTTNLNETNSNYIEDFQELSSASSANNISSSSIIIRVKTKDPAIQQNKDNQFLHPHTSLIKPVPIIIREIFHKPSPCDRSISNHDSQIVSTAANEFYPISKSIIKPKHKIIYEPIPLTRHEHHTDEQSRKIIIEYDQINVTVNKNIKQRKEIKRVNPNQYIQEYGNSLYTNEVFQNLLTNIIA
ncbi:unnamed protein product [Rotaria sp. Silwood1]|nr:unnamed protein product [Rotaria sp. Silwood1]